MESIYLLILFIICVFLCFFLYISGKRTIVDPTVGVFFFFSLSLGCALLGNARWGNSISLDFFATIAICFLGIIVGTFLGRNIHSTSKKEGIKEVFGLQRIEISNWKLFIVVGLSCLLSLAYVLNIILAGKSLGASGLGSIAVVRGSKDVSSNFIIRQGIKFTMAAAFVNNFIFANNMLAKWRAKDIIYLLPTICGCICSVFTGVRTEIFRLIISLGVNICIVNYEKRRWKHNNSSIKYLIKKFAIPIILFVVAFFSLRTIVKSTTTLSENSKYNIFEYLFFYVGGTWIVLNTKIGMGLEIFKGTLFGENTFSSFYTDMIDFKLLNKPNGLVPTTYIVIDPVKNASGNVDTMFGNPLVDFGKVGTFLFVTILFFLLSYFYHNRLLGSYSSYKRNRHLIVYSFVFYLVAMGFYANVFTYYLSVYFFLTYILIRMIYWFYYKVKL